MHVKGLVQWVFKYFHESLYIETFDSSIKYVHCQGRFVRGSDVTQIVELARIYGKKELFKRASKTWRFSFRILFFFFLTTFAQFLRKVYKPQLNPGVFFGLLTFSRFLRRLSNSLCTTVRFLSSVQLPLASHASCTLFIDKNSPESRDFCDSKLIAKVFRKMLRRKLAGKVNFTRAREKLQVTFVRRASGTWNILKFH